MQRGLMLLHRWKVCLKWVISIGGTCSSNAEMIHAEWKCLTCCKRYTRVDANQDTCKHCITASVSLGKGDTVRMVKRYMHLTLGANKSLTQKEIIWRKQ